jgi:hypothetical protein
MIAQRHDKLLVAIVGFLKCEHNLANLNYRKGSACEVGSDGNDEP